MPDVTVTFTDAQWARVVAATPDIKKFGEGGDVDEAYLAARWQKQVEKWVESYEKRITSIDSWEQKENRNARYNNYGNGQFLM